MKALLVVDIQPDTVATRNIGNLIETANNIIGTFDPARVFYIENLKPFAKQPEEAQFADGLKIVSDNVYFKRRSDAFSNPKLLESLQALRVDEVDIIGIDGNWCIKGTALGALKSGLKVNVVTSAVVSKNEDAFKNRTVEKLVDAGIKVV